MKTGVIVVTLVFLAAGANAQWAPIDNYLTILWDPYSTAYDYNCEYQVENTIVTYTLYLHDPVNPQFMDQGARPVTNVGGFECRIEATEGVNILDWSFPVPAIDIGENGNHIVGFSEPVPVVDGRVALVTGVSRPTGIAATVAQRLHDRACGDQTLLVRQRNGPSFGERLEKLRLAKRLRRFDGDEGA